MRYMVGLFGALHGLVHYMVGLFVHYMVGLFGALHGSCLVHYMVGLFGALHGRVVWCTTW